MKKRILLIIISIITILIIATYFSYDYWLERKLKYQFSEIISKDPNNLYTYSFTKLNIHLLEGSVDLYGVSIQPKENAFDSLISMSNGIRYLLSLSLDKIELNGFEIKKFLSTGKIYVNSLIISKPIFKYYFHPRKRKASSNLVLNNLFSDKFKEANIKDFLIHKALVKIIDFSKSGPAVTIQDLSVELKSAHLDSATLKQFTPIEYTDIQAKAAGVNINVAKDFELNSDSILFKVKEQTIELNRFQLNPKFSKKNFAKAYRVQKQWVALHLQKLIISQINFNEFVRTGAVDIGKMVLQIPNIALYKDKRKPLPPFKKKKLPASAINNIPWNIAIDSIAVNQGSISIEETSALTGKDSHLTINNLSALILNYTNDSVKQDESPQLTIDASALVMNKAATQIEMKFNLNSLNDHFIANGNVGKVDAKVFNPVLEPIMGIKVTSGTINNLNFYINAMDTLSTGNLDIEYKNIKIEVQHTDTKANKNKKGFISLAANTIIKRNNLRTQGNYRQGIINTKRVLEKDVWPYLWHSIQSGLVSTMVPVTNNKEARHKQKKTRQKLKANNKKR